MKVAEKPLKEILTSLLITMGAADKEARLVADVLVQADMRGIHTHGCSFFPLIAERKAAAMINIPTRTQRIVDDEAVTLIDGNNGLGQVAAAEAMEVCISKAEKFGVAVTLVRNTNHIGFLAYYALMAVKKGMIGVCMTNAAPSMAPWGGAEPLFGTNPLSIAASVSDRSPIVLDMSSSVAARGKIRRAARLNEKIPQGWALDSKGNPTTDPAEALKGTVLPIAGPKGYGLALFIDLICGLLSGSKYGRDLLSFHQPIGPTGVGAMLMAIDISRFMPRERFEILACEYAEAIIRSKKAMGVSRIYLPGEIEAENEKISGTQGIDLDAQIIEKINQICKEKGLSVHLEELRS
ncbi:MAG: Ldh family oxidoreductase [Deltaproteobacteria bacterium]|nr:Ldh family oxidoreductase [Deltaproteobacteria bacterium]